MEGSFLITPLGGRGEGGGGGRGFIQEMAYRKEKKKGKWEKRDSQRLLSCKKRTFLWEKKKVGLKGE